LTQFGFNAVATDLDVAQGGVLYRLLMRAFPGWYECNSVYALFPLTIPSETKKIFTDLGLASSYSFKAPSKPIVPKVFSTGHSARAILENQQAFNVISAKAISNSTFDSNAMDEAWDFYCKRTTKLLDDKSYRLGTYYQFDAARE
jgi:hypothetical protein